ncbi:hypothetical protein OSTOST_04394 [Ostertagia ostertagi]
MWSQICYPMTTILDVDYLVRVEPLGQFLPNMTSYWMHDVGGLYAIGKAENQEINLATLKRVEHESLCRHSSSVMLCNLREQMPGCGLLSADRHNCRLVMHNSTDKHFTMVRPLARSVIIATRATRIREMPQQTIGKPRPARIVTNPVFAVEVPKGKWLLIGDEQIDSRVVQGVMGTDFKIIVPVPIGKWTGNHFHQITAQHKMQRFLCRAVIWFLCMTRLLQVGRLRRTGLSGESEITQKQYCPGRFLAYILELPNGEKPAFGFHEM